MRLHTHNKTLIDPYCLSRRCRSERAVRVFYFTLMANIKKVYVDKSTNSELTAYFNKDNEVCVKIEHNSDYPLAVCLDSDSLYEFICDLNALHTKMCNE